MSDDVITYRRFSERPARDYVTGAWTRRIRSTSMALMIAGVAAGLVALPFLPEEIPTHFGFTGEADAWGSKWSLLGMLALWAVMQIGMDALSRHPRLINFPGPLTSANAQRLYRVGEQMLVWLSASLAIVFLGIVGMVLGLPTVALAMIGLVGTLVATFGGIARLGNAS
ncbi:DUF1648 domain-containing protein [Arenivirga flava]|uniref:DUF1648 domain-containing protein n=1 Tax=Arenivirga flava TaxID=1930060 RepID=A0AA37XC26_9MICO|nr:DUF1648 domain-containing protein [Arenivirga flava]GMA29356.1 hypothetical protein GCM10025874_26090 [Arenivirga flava]